jgi:hypothetical protein
MFRPNLSPADQLALARARLAARIPQGAARGALAGAPQQQYPQQQQYPMVPQGADQGAMAGCGVGGFGPWCGGVPAQPFMGMPSNPGPWVQPQSLLGIIATPSTFGSFTLSITCGNKFFSGCGARSFNDPLQLIVTSIISGFNGYERTCGPDAGFDVAYWNTDDCWCPFDWGCFSNLAPLTITFDPIDTLSVLPTLDMIIVGQALNLFDDCWPWMPPSVPPPGGFGGAYPGGYAGVPPGLPPSGVPVP